MLQEVIRDLLQHVFVQPVKNRKDAPVKGGDGIEAPHGFGERLEPGFRESIFLGLCGKGAMMLGPR